MHEYNFKKSQLYGLDYTFFLEEIQIIHGISLHFLNLTFLRYIMVLDFSVFTHNNSFITKIKNLDRHVVENWTLIKIQFRI